MDGVILDVIDNFVGLKGIYLEGFMLISLLALCQEWGVKKGGTLRMLRVPDQRHGGKGHS